MFKIGDEIIYSVHGLCKIDDICEKTISGVTKQYYVLQPLGQSNLTISTPVDNDKVVILKKLTKDEAFEILQSFKQPGVDWIHDVKLRAKSYNQIIKAGNRNEIAKVANTLLRKENKLQNDKKRLYDYDRKLLTTIQDILFKELADALNTNLQHINDQIDSMIKKDTTTLV